jgi:DNA-binding MarR family transcriptional regulator
MFFEDESKPLEHRVAMGLQKIGLALKHQLWRQANEDGLSPTQGQILAIVALSPSSSSEIATRLGVSLPTVSDSVRALVEKGLVIKEADPRHPRASLLKLTTAGKRIASKVAGWPEFLSSAVGSMSNHEQEVFLSGLVKMIRSLQEDGQIPVNRMCVTCRYFRPNVHEGDAPHHCAFVDAPMKLRHLRLDCAEHEAATPEQQAEAWKRFVNAG